MIGALYLDDHHIVLHMPINTRVFCHRVLFAGGNNLFVFIDPVEAGRMRKKGKKLPEVTWDFAMGEIGRNAGLDTANGEWLSVRTGCKKVWREARIPGGWT